MGSDSQGMATAPNTQDTRGAVIQANSPSADMLDTVSLYLHVPFCHAKCHYCDFNSYAGMLGLREAYVEALSNEITLAGRRARRADGAPRHSRTIFFGGGTPSLLTGAQVAQLLDAAHAAFTVDDGAEVTLEANPGALESGRLDELRAAGVNRLSMGAQSFDAGLLRWMGRIHGPDDIEMALQAARSAGFRSVNLDFIFAIPGQTLALWSETLDRALTLRPEHLSLYSLIVEEGTALHRWVDQGRVQPPDDDLAADMYEMACERLAQAGYKQYEISNWSLPGYACQHNLTYWGNLPYIGLGAGAHGWYQGQRYVEAKPIREYIARVQAEVAQDVGRRGEKVGAPVLPAGAVVSAETIAATMEMAETAIVGLRLIDGVDLKLFARRFGISLVDVYGERLSTANAFGLIEYSDGRLRLTERGRLLGNEVFALFLPENTKERDGALKRGVAQQ